jgi:hypothetical protein
MENTIEKLAGKTTDANNRGENRFILSGKQKQMMTQQFNMLAKEIHPSMMLLLSRAKEAGFGADHSLNLEDWESFYTIIPPSERHKVSFVFYMDDLVEDIFLRITVEKSVGRVSEIMNKKIADVNAVQDIMVDVLGGLARVVNHMD